MLKLLVFILSSHTLIYCVRITISKSTTEVVGLDSSLILNNKSTTFGKIDLKIAFSLSDKKFYFFTLLFSHHNLT